MNKINKLSLPATILIASVILGGFYYAAEINKQKSIERQQQNQLSEAKKIREEKSLQESYDALNRSLCVSEAEMLAQKQYKETCTYGCKDGYFYTANYESYFKTCLQKKGLQ